MRSLQAQDFADLEVIAVDDGSTDGSGALLDELARSEPRLTVIHQANAGLGAARNRGIAASRGELLTFLDPDDLLPEGAYRRLVGALRASGSDLVVGAIERFEEDPAERWQPRWSQVAHEQARSGVTIDDAPQALLDIVACNRVVRREAWDRVVGRFPEGVVYEDHVPILRLYLEAGRFDVLHETTYLWRRRPDESSLAQQKHELRNLQDRVLAKQHGREAVEAHGSAAVRRWYAARVLGVDLPPFLKGAVLADDQYWREARGFATSFVADAERDGEVWDLLEARQRVAAWLAAHDERAALAALYARQEEHGASRLPVEVVAGEVLLSPGAWSAPGDAVPTVPQPLRRLSARETGLRLVVTQVAVDGEDLVVTARVRLRQLGGLGPTTVRAALVSQDGQVRVGSSATTLPGPDDEARFRLGLEQVRTAVEDGGPLHLVAEAEVGGVRREADRAETAMRGRLRGRGLELAPGLRAVRGGRGLLVA